MKIFLLTAVNAQHLQALGNGSVIGCNHPSVAAPPKFFEGKKLKHPYSPKVQYSAAIPGTDSLRSVFDDDQIVRPGDVRMESISAGSRRDGRALSREYRG